MRPSFRRVSVIPAREMISAKPNIPMARGTRSMPSASSELPKVKRRTPEIASVPTTPSNIPSAAMPIVFENEPWERAEDATSASRTIEQ